VCSGLETPESYFLIQFCFITKFFTTLNRSVNIGIHLPSLFKVHIDAAYLYDAIYLYALAYNQTKTAGGDPYNATQLMKNVFYANFKGLS